MGFNQDMYGTDTPSLPDRERGTLTGMSVRPQKFGDKYYSGNELETEVHYVILALIHSVHLRVGDAVYSFRTDLENFKFTEGLNEDKFGNTIFVADGYTADKLNTLLPQKDARMVNSTLTNFFVAPLAHDEGERVDTTVQDTIYVTYLKNIQTVHIAVGAYTYSFRESYKFHQGKNDSKYNKAMFILYEADADRLNELVSKAVRTGGLSLSDNVRVSGYILSHSAFPQVEKPLWVSDIEVSVALGRVYLSVLIEDDDKPKRYDYSFAEGSFQVGVNTDTFGDVLFLNNEKQVQYLNALSVDVD